MDKIALLIADDDGVKGVRVKHNGKTRDLVAQGRKVAMFPIHEYWLDIGRPDDFARAQIGLPQ